MIKKILFLLLVSNLFFVNSLYAATTQDKKNQENTRDQASLQRGAKLFINNCLSCHSASTMRFSRLADIGLTETDIQKNLMFDQGKINDPMLSAMSTEDAQIWFGNPPPDLSSITHAKSENYLYAYLTGFYRDTSRPLSWNNTAAPNTVMPHVLWEYQGVWEMEQNTNGMNALKVKQITPGKLTPEQYHTMTQDLVNYLSFMGEPEQAKRKRMGYWVLLFLGIVMLPLTYFLKREYWKDLH